MKMGPATNSLFSTFKLLGAVSGLFSSSFPIGKIKNPKNAGNKVKESCKFSLRLFDVNFLKNVYTKNL